MPATARNPAIGWLLSYGDGLTLAIVVREEHLDLSLKSTMGRGPEPLHTSATFFGEALRSTMYLIDWDATGSMTGGIGSIVAVGVAIWLSEVQHRRTLRLIREKDAELRATATHEALMLAMWASSITFDLRVKADAYWESYSSISINTREELFDPGNFDGFAALLTGFALNIEALSPRMLDALPRFERNAGTAVAKAIRLAMGFDQRNILIARHVSTGKVRSGSVAKSLRLQAANLRRVVDACDEAYTLLAKSYGFPCLDTQLQEYNAQKLASDEG